MKLKICYSDDESFLQEFKDCGNLLIEIKMWSELHAKLSDKLTDNLWSLNPYHRRNIEQCLEQTEKYAIQKAREWRDRFISTEDNIKPSIFR